MAQLLIVIASSVGVVAFLMDHKYGGALSVGVVVGAFYFLKAVITGGGIAQVRITQDPGVVRKPADPAGSIGMGLAASGIAAGAMGSPDYTQGLGPFLPCAVAAGILIALGYAITGASRQLRAKTTPDDPGTELSSNNKRAKRTNNGA